ncbi:hypothetical protein Tco_0420886 [Tanacetum coccineum]
MTTPRPTPFPATTPHAEVLIPFVIISDPDDEIATLPVRPAPPSSDRIPALSGYPLDSGDDSSDEDLSETAESLHTQTAPTLVVYSPPSRPLSSSPALARRQRKEISTSPPTLLPSSFSPPPSLLPFPSRKRSRSPLPSLPPLVSPSPLPLSQLPAPPPAVETVTLRARVGLLEQHDAVTRDSLRIARGRITWSQLRAVYVEPEDIEASCVRAEAAEQLAETLQVSLGVVRMDVRDLIESREADMLEMAELRSRAQDIEASFWDLERHLDP